ncbi:hypothetical protein HHI36_002640, partial [Cryptolaemus montrouzieri]
MEKQSMDLLQKYNQQLATNEKLNKEINEKYKLDSEMNKNAQNLLTRNIILEGITNEEKDENLKA